MAQPTIKSAYGDGGRTLTTTAQENPNLVGNANLLRALTQDRKSDYEGRRLGRGKEVHERALIPPSMSGAQQMRALTAPTVQGPIMQGPTSAPVQRQQQYREPEQVYLPYMPPGGIAASYAPPSYGWTNDPSAIARGYLV